MLLELVSEAKAFNEKNLSIALNVPETFCSRD